MRRDSSPAKTQLADLPRLSKKQKKKISRKNTNKLSYLSKYVKKSKAQYGVPTTQSQVGEQNH